MTEPETPSRIRDAMTFGKWCVIFGVSLFIAMGISMVVPNTSEGSIAFLVACGIGAWIVFRYRYRIYEVIHES